MSASFIIRVIRAQRGFAVAPKPAEISNDIDQTDDTGDFDESSLSAFGAGVIPSNEL